MQELLEKRLAELKTEFQDGEKMLGELENKQANLRNTTLLRISGAIQVLEEELHKIAPGEHNEPRTDAPPTEA
ncbi:MAG: hypothetical protein GKS05_10925 [Nitrospirales bacterium]|nr:hypothetical protein [Nitrospirales bacterium]